MLPWLCRFVSQQIDRVNLGIEADCPRELRYCVVAFRNCFFDYAFCKFGGSMRFSCCTVRVVDTSMIAKVRLTPYANGEGMHRHLGQSASTTCDGASLVGVAVERKALFIAAPILPHLWVTPIGEAGQSFF
ncbi:Hypothetical protein, putative [Bodo saltans]|uniref:Uncharacterized protein n=1 Tax=Bodo saltans TaxID=75058 RepID=A0A0S4JE20_BODSA|nr:Hypothetical protein, putative [Bodo saltans]|eukprot:CUG88368.1 Hypothetical protein, putative [Bodo saltans]